MINYALNDDVATLHFDDGKANVISPASAKALLEALDQAEAEAKVIVLKGRGGQFSAGFDLKAFQSGDFATMQVQALAGFEVLVRLVACPRPLVTISEGHAIGLGAFFLLAADNRIASDQICKIGLPETALDMALVPSLLSDLARYRLSKRHFILSALQSKMYTPNEAVEAGFLDVVVEKEALDSLSQRLIEQLKMLPAKRYTSNKLDLKSEIIASMSESLESVKQNPEKLFGKGAG